MQSPFFKESFLLLYANSVKVVDFQHQVKVYNALLCLFKQTWYLSLSKNLCFDNGILLPKLFWPTVRKNCSSDWEKLLKFEAEGQEFANVWDH